MVVSLYIHTLPCPDHTKANLDRYVDITIYISVGHWHDIGRVK
jgi:hypothetical protein